MNLNEECLLQFLNNPERLEFLSEKLKSLIFCSESNIIKFENKIQLSSNKVL